MLTGGSGLPWLDADHTGIDLRWGSEIVSTHFEYTVDTDTSKELGID